MSRSNPNITRRDGWFYYRASFSLDGKVYQIRLSLRTADRSVARQRAALMDQLLKDQWQKIVSELEGLNETDKASILRATAIKVRNGLEHLHAREQAYGHDDARYATLEHLRTLRGLRYVARDMFTNGIGPSFGSLDHFLERFVNGMPDLDFEQQLRIQEILENAGQLADATDAGARKALLDRNLPITAANIVMARRQMLLGVLLALREAEQNTREPERALDDMLAALSMPPSVLPQDTPEWQTASAGFAGQHALEGAVTPVQSHNAPAEVPPPLCTNLAAAGNQMTIAGAAAAFLNANPAFDQGLESSRWTSKTRSQFDAAIFLAEKFFGPEMSISAIDETMIANLFRTLRSLPSNHHKTPMHTEMTLGEIAAKNKGKGLSSATTNRHMRFLKLVFDWAMKRVPGCPPIDWSAYIIADKRVKRDKRPAFSVQELETLFSGPIWHGSESKVRRLKHGKHVWHDSAYWIPILLTYTGARREEIAKLMVSDVEQSHGLWVIKVRPTETGRVKTGSSVRDIPIADEVIRLGFLKFVERQREHGHRAIFADLGLGASNYGDAFYKKWWRAFIRTGLVAENKDMHSIRHFVATELANLGVSEERRADLLGHTINTSETARTYTKATRLEIMKQVVDTIPKVTKRLKAYPINQL